MPLTALDALGLGQHVRAELVQHEHLRRNRGARGQVEQVALRGVDLVRGEEADRLAVKGVAALKAKLAGIGG